LRGQKNFKEVNLLDLLIFLFIMGDKSAVEDFDDNNEDISFHHGR
jgi:hypothetical protein